MTMPRAQSLADPEAQAQAALAYDCRALNDVMTERLRQVFEFGHTPAMDLRHSLSFMLRQLIEPHFRSAQDHAAAGPAKYKYARRALVRLAACAIATIDRIDTLGEAIDEDVPPAGEEEKADHG